MEDVKKLNFNLLTLGGGISLGSITELAGQSGLGKTQACIQWSLSVQLPAQFGGVEGRCVYLDCDGNFCPERASEMASSLMRSDSRLAQDTEESSISNRVKLFLDGIFYRRIDSIKDLESALNFLNDDFLKTYTDVRLIVVDSLAFHFRYSLLTESASISNTALLHWTMQILNSIASKFNIAVIVINQVTTVVKEDEPESKPEELIPALGESFSHAASTRIWFDYVKRPKGNEDQQLRPNVTTSDPKICCVKLLKSPKCPISIQPKYFAITAVGPTDADLA